MLCSARFFLVFAQNQVGVAAEIVAKIEEVEPFVSDGRWAGVFTRKPIKSQC
jgi:hypothetical protein